MPVQVHSFPCTWWRVMPLAAAAGDDDDADAPWMHLLRDK